MRAGQVWNARAVGMLWLLNQNSMCALLAAKARLSYDERAGQSEVARCREEVLRAEGRLLACCAESSQLQAQATRGGSRTAAERGTSAAHMLRVQTE